MVFALLILGSVAVMAKPTWKDEGDAGLISNNNMCDLSIP